MGRSWIRLKLQYLVVDGYSERNYKMKKTKHKKSSPDIIVESYDKDSVIVQHSTKKKKKHRVHKDDSTEADESFNIENSEKQPNTEKNFGKKRKNIDLEIDEGDSSNTKKKHKKIKNQEMGENVCNEPLEKDKDITTNGVNNNEFTKMKKIQNNSEQY